MGCASSKQAVSVTPAIDHSGAFRGNVADSGRKIGESDRNLVEKTTNKKKKNQRSDSAVTRSELGESGRTSTNGGESVSFRLGNLHRYAEGEHVAAGWPAWLSAVAGEAIHGWIPLRADAFEKLEKIGQGTYSSVFRAKDLETGKIVALKKVRFDNFEPESVRFMAREITILRRLDHPNIVKLQGLITSRLSCSIYLVFEYMEHDITGMLSSPDIKFTEPQVCAISIPRGDSVLGASAAFSALVYDFCRICRYEVLVCGYYFLDGGGCFFYGVQIKCYMKQLLSGLEHCHSRGVMHRDIKGSNLLVNNEGVLKVADFGLANFSSSGHKHPLTSRVVTLWYRPPELLLGATDYGPAVDLWSVGCVFAELLVGKPILQGRTEVEQLHKIFKLCGSPPDEYWKKTRLPHATLFKPQQAYDSCLRESFKDLPSSSVNLLQTLLSVEPYKRGNATSALSSEYFKTKPHACDPSSLPMYPPSKEIDVKHREESRKKISGRARGAETRKTSRKALGINKLVPAEDMMSKTQTSQKVNGTSFLNEEKTNPGVEARKPSSGKFEDAFHLKNASQEDIPFSGPLQVSISTGFAWAKSLKEGASIRSHCRTISRGNIFNPLEASTLNSRNNNLDNRNQENKEFCGRHTNSRGSDLLDISKLSMQNQWSNFDRPDSFDASDEYHSQELSMALYQREDSVSKRSNLSYQDQGEKVEFSGPLLSQMHTVDELLERHERHIQRTVRRSWFHRAKKHAK